MGIDVAKLHVIEGQISADALNDNEIIEQLAQAGLPEVAGAVRRLAQQCGTYHYDR